MWKKGQKSSELRTKISCVSVPTGIEITVTPQGGQNIQATKQVTGISFAPVGCPHKVLEMLIKATEFAAIFMTSAHDLQ